MGDEIDRFSGLDLTYNDTLDPKGFQRIGRIGKCVEWTNLSFERHRAGEKSLEELIEQEVIEGQGVAAATMLMGAVSTELHLRDLGRHLNHFRDLYSYVRGSLGSEVLRGMHTQLTQEFETLQTRMAQEPIIGGSHSVLPISSLAQEQHTPLSTLNRFVHAVSLEDENAINKGFAILVTLLSYSAANMDREDEFPEGLHPRTYQVLQAASLAVRQYLAMYAQEQSEIAPRLSSPIDRSPLHHPLMTMLLTWYKHRYHDQQTNPPTQGVTQTITLEGDDLSAAARRKSLLAEGKLARHKAAEAEKLAAQAAVKPTESSETAVAEEIPVIPLPVICQGRDISQAIKDEIGKYIAKMTVQERLGYVTSDVSRFNLSDGRTLYFRAIQSTNANDDEVKGIRLVDPYIV